MMKNPSGTQFYMKFMETHRNIHRNHTKYRNHMKERNAKQNILLPLVLPFARRQNLYSVWNLYESNVLKMVCESQCEFGMWNGRKPECQNLNHSRKRKAWKKCRQKDWQSKQIGQNKQEEMSRKIGRQKSSLPVGGI